jgi:hypothetical protein
MNALCWITLNLDISDWLTTIVRDQRRQEWAWGQDLFWLMFVAAYLTFPLSPWPLWDPRIPLEGHFIQHWIEKVYDHMRGDEQSEPSDVVQRVIWSDFQLQASLFYPCPLVSP